MRSRYTAYVRRNHAYLLSTWHPSTRPTDLDLDDSVWLGLEVLASDAGREDDVEGVVAFVAHHQDADGAVAALEETSRFVREEGAWLYVNGDPS
jgi:SEC-C motif-containing protein